VAHSSSSSARRLRPPRQRSLCVAGASAVVLALALGGCASNQPEAESLTVEAGAPSDSPTGPAASSDAATDPATADPLAAGDTPPADVPPTSTPTHRAVVKVTAKPRPRVTVTATVRAGTPAPGGSGTASPSASPAVDLKAVLAAQSSALGSVTSVHVVGTVVSGGEKYGVDLQMGADGGEGVLTFAKGSLGVRRVGTKLFLNADDAFFTAHKHPELIAQYKGLWMPIDPGDPAYATILPLTQVAKWAKLATGAPATAAKAGTPVGGQATVAITGGSGGKASTLFVAAKAPVLPLLAVSADNADRLEFQDWNGTAPKVTAPTGLKDEPADEIVDVPAFAEESAAAFAKLWVA